MTLFLDFRSSGTGGVATSAPRVYEADIPDAGSPIAYRDVKILPDTLDLNILFATHGFNVDRPKGVRSLHRLAQKLALGEGWLFVGVLWPGDWGFKIPLNYPAEGRDADACGRFLAAFADSHFPGAASISLLSHSMGARVVLTAAGLTRQPVGQICVAAPAVDDRTLGVRQRYDVARNRAARTTVMSSKADVVLAAAYPAGTLAALTTGLDDMPLGLALGFNGSNPRPLMRVDNTVIPVGQNYGHGDYFPPEDMSAVNARSDRSITVMAKALRGDPARWPF